MQYKDYLIMNQNVREYVKWIGLRYVRQYSHFGKKVRRTKFWCVSTSKGVAHDALWNVMDHLLKFDGVADALYHRNIGNSMCSITVYYK